MVFATSIFRTLAAACLAAAAMAPAWAEVPVPSPRPERPTETEDSSDSTSDTARLPDSERRCRARLRALGAAFTPRPPIAEDGGCAVAHPIETTALAENVAVAPAAVLNCTTALALARFFAGPADELARRHLGRPIATVRHASAYVCRPRRGTDTMSEHAFANAFDIAAFVLADGSRIAVRAHADEETPPARFLKAFRETACGPFRTVLGPGADADHARHFHLDMKERRTAYCR